MRQPSGRRSQTWLWAPRRPEPLRRYSAVATATSGVSATMSTRSELAGDVGDVAALAEGGDRLDAVEAAFGHQADRLRALPEVRRQRLHVVQPKRRLVAVEGGAHLGLHGARVEFHPRSPAVSRREVTRKECA